MALRRAPDVAFVTFTKRHSGDSLDVEWDKLDAVRSRFTERGTWFRFKKRHGITGYALVTEVMRSVQGWHVHMHCVLTLSLPLSDKAFSSLGEAIVARWVAAAAHVGVVASERRQQVQRVPTSGRDEVAGYMTKQNLLRCEREKDSAPPGYLLKRSQEDFNDLDTYVEWFEYTSAARGRTFISQYGEARGLRA